jgi:hypothetical protein
MKLIATVNNLPTNLSKYAWITARAVDGELWFYGAWYDEDGAREQAREIDGIALKVEG